MILTSDDETLDAFIQSLDGESLNHILGKILTELRVREKEEMRLDFITQNKRLTMGEGHPAPLACKAVKF